MALNAYRRCDSAYLQMFIHLHIAYIHIYAGRLEAADSALDDADTCLGQCGNPACESAMIAITRHWISAERSVALPSLADLQPLSAQITEGEFWPETFPVLAALQVRAAMAEGQPALPDQHNAMEFTLRNRGMQPLLPAMQLLREEFQTGTARKKGWQPLGLPDRQLVLLLPTLRTWRLNHGEAEVQPARMARIQAVRALHAAQLWRTRGRFDLAMEHLVPAMEIIQARGYGFFAGQRGRIYCRYRARMPPARAVCAKGAGLAAPSGKPETTPRCASPAPALWPDAQRNRRAARHACQHLQQGACAGAGGVGINGEIPSEKHLSQAPRP